MRGCAFFVFFFGSVSVLFLGKILGVGWRVGYTYITKKKTTKKRRRKKKKRRRREEKARFLCVCCVFVRCVWVFAVRESLGS